MLLLLPAAMLCTHQPTQPLEVLAGDREGSIGGSAGGSEQGGSGRAWRQGATAAGGAEAGEASDVCVSRL